MTQTNPQLTRILNRLLRTCHASEQGFLVAAENVDNRALKILFRRYAAERAAYAWELQIAIEQAGGSPSLRSSLMAAIHRGWINLKSAMTIGKTSTEIGVLSEVLRGERVARRAFASARDQPLPEALSALVETQYAGIQTLRETLQQLRGNGERRMLVRLFDNQPALDTAQDALHAGGIETNDMQQVALADQLSGLELNPTGAPRTTGDTALTAALLGAALGLLLSFFVALGILTTPVTAAGTIMNLLYIALLGAASGFFIGALLGAFIGRGIVQEDAYRYADSLQHGQILVYLPVNASRAQAAARIMRGVNARNWQPAT